MVFFFFFRLRTVSFSIYISFCFIDLKSFEMEISIAERITLTWIKIRISKWDCFPLVERMIYAKNWMRIFCRSFSSPPTSWIDEWMKPIEFLFILILHIDESSCENPERDEIRKKKHSICCCCYRDDDKGNPGNKIICFRRSFIHSIPPSSRLLSMTKYENDSWKCTFNWCKLANRIKLLNPKWFKLTHSVL